MLSNLKTTRKGKLSILWSFE